MPTYTDPATGKTWTSGGRGRIPTFVKALVAGGTVTLPVKRESPKVILNVSDVGLKAWRWRGGSEEDAKAQVGCIVMANSESEALSFLNKTMKIIPVSQLEFTTCWKRISQIEAIKKEGVYVLKGDIWEERQNKA